ncbi:MAG: DUF4105 domain-containing protein [Longimicrobiales bacterium]
MKVLLIALASLHVTLQEPSVAALVQSVEPGSELTIFLMTMGPGDAVWEKFGHNAIWVHDASRGTDVAYNYGMFSFDEPGYLGRFLRGDMQYWMQPFSGPGSAVAYHDANRSVLLQELALTPAQRVGLRDFLEWNAREENKFYAYDYYRDNCSTRVRDAIDQAVGGALQRALSAQPTGTTYRDHSLRLTASAAATYTGLLLGLGPTVDKPISAWEEGFIPMKLSEHIRTVRVPGPNGVLVPLIRSEQMLFEASREPEALSPPNRTLAYLAVGLLLSFVFVILASLSSRLAGTAFLTLAVGWCLVIGLFGSVLAALWAFTNHTVAYRNENLFQVNPLPLVLAVLLPMTGRSLRLAQAAILVALAIAAISLLGFVLQPLPGLDQVNGGIIALTLPVHLALLAGLLIRFGRTASSSKDAPPARKRSIGKAPAPKPA